MGMKRVKICMDGTRSSGGMKENFQENYVGTLEVTNGIYGITYYEKTAEGDICNKVELSPGKALITKDGILKVTMEIVPGEVKEVLYSIPQGSLSFQSKGSEVSFRETKDGLEARLQYVLGFGGGYDQKTEMNIRVVSAE